MSWLVHDRAGSGISIIIPKEPDYTTIDRSDYGNICGCCGAYAVNSVEQLQERADQRHNQGIMVGLNLPIDQLPDDGATNYVHISLDNGDVLTIRERTKKGKGCS